MTIELNHTIVAATDKKASAQFLADILGLEVAPQYGPFIPVAIPNGVTLDYFEGDGGPIVPQHYAFLVSDEEFDAIFGRIKERGLTYWADPYHKLENQINTNDGGRGVYWDDPDGHKLEIITKPYGAED
ncbi:VOC family protein [Streptomyces aurantiacus]|uniref:Putative Glutathione transferase FosA n=1 Tax=Streptomyces aurantiacus JA 4570 TaxID=1286094 RepID=S3ZZY7_9ACTN|nr:VOC family protein [Streptomyces aurantiacus]EPH44005.1 putative Glutathione transferase FosA [Streptomyces aurantiacus JA 4570]